MQASSDQQAGRIMAGWLAEHRGRSASVEDVVGTGGVAVTLTFGDGPRPTVLIVTDDPQPAGRREIEFARGAPWSLRGWLAPGTSGRAATIRRAVALAKRWERRASKRG